MPGPPRRYRYGARHGGEDPPEPQVDLRSALDTLGREIMEGASPRAALDELLRTGTSETGGLDELTRRLWRRRRELQRRYRIDGTSSRVRALLDRALGQERQAPLQIPPADVERVRRVLEDLAGLLDAHARGDADVAGHFDRFMTEHGEFFPEEPPDADELVDVLVARSAAARRSSNSMTEQQRAELGSLSQQAFGDPRIGRALDRMDTRLRSLRPGEDRQGSSGFRGDQPPGLGEATAAMAELGELDRLAEQLGQAYPGASPADIDVEALERQLGPRAVVDARRLSEMDEQLREQGMLRLAADGSLQLGPRALRRLGETALRSVISQLRSRRGECDADRAGVAGELTGSTRPWGFGASEPRDAGRTVREAVLRRAMDRATGSPSPDSDVSDLEIAETEQRCRAAVALCVDTSWSMVQDGRWVPMKRTALALHQLISTRYRSDALRLITFGRCASTVDVGELIAAEGTWEQGTNLHHALLLAGRHVRRNPDARPVVLVVTDGEPTAHLEPDGRPVFRYPPSPRTLSVTLSEVDALSRLGATLSVYMLGEDERLAAFVDLLARRGRVRVVAPTADGLGVAVVGDYLRAKSRH